jgi:hypothetical protein
MHDRPKARTEYLLREWIEDELVIYDQVHEVAHCLSAEAAAVWELCDGTRAETDITQQLGLPPDTVRRAVESLRECRLLDDSPGAAPGLSRREAAFRMAKVGGAALAAPLVYSVNVRSAAAAASHLAPGCRVTFCGTCSSTVGCGLCSTAGTNSTNALCLTGRCYCSVVTPGGVASTILRCAVVATTCKGDAVTGACNGGNATAPCGCSTAAASVCCGNGCTSAGSCRPQSVGTCTQ